MKRSTLYITTGIIFLVSFIALYGLLLEASTLTRSIWEVLYLVIGLLILKGISKTKKASTISSVFYLVNLILVIWYKLASGSNDTLFFTLTALLILLGFLISFFHVRTDNEVKSYLPIDAIAIDGKTVAESDKPVKKTVKKKAKKTVKKKAKKKK